MNRGDGKIRWAPKVPQQKIRRLYQTDAKGIIDDELINDVGWALWERCDSILTVTEAHYGRVRCPSCENIIERRDRGSDNEIVKCEKCGWQIKWANYHHTYRRQQLFGANAVDVFQKYHVVFPRSHSAKEKMILIDQLIHEFHVGLKELGRPVAANLIEGKLYEVIRFLDELTYGGESTAEGSLSRDAWRRKLVSASWSKHFIGSDENAHRENI
jgi:ribosomal protein L37AE/L43A